MSDMETNKQSSNTESSNSGKELEKILHASHPASSQEKESMKEEAQVIDVKNDQKSKMEITIDGFKFLVIMWLVFLTVFLGYQQYTAQTKVSLTEHEIVFYPFGKANKLLKSQGYDFKAIQQYNENMIRILNNEGKVVLPAATAHGSVPDSLVVELMSVSEMNDLAAKHKQ